MKEFNKRREKLFEALPDNSLTLVFAGASKIRSEDEFYPFYANRNFFYLTGIEQENSVLMLVKCPGEHKEYLFLDEHNELKERWTGKRLSFDSASEISQIANVYSTNNFEVMLQMGLSQENNIYGNISHLYLDLSDELKIKPGMSTQLYKQELEEKYPNLSRKERENAICKEYGAVFLIGIGGKLKDGQPHDARAADYDDWKMNGDILLWYEPLQIAFELSSMGIRVNKESLVKQLKTKKEEWKLELPYHQQILNDELPLSIGGGIGQSRLCMYLLKKVHIGEVQSSYWPEEDIKEFKKYNVNLL